MKLFKSLAILGLGEAMPAGSGSGGLCEADSAAGCTGLLCSWNGSQCNVSGSFSPGNGAIKAKLDMAMSGMELSNLKTDFDNDKGQLESASRSSAFSGFGMSFGSFGMGMGMMSMLPNANKYFTCPIDVPFCERTACVSPHLDIGPNPTSQNAYACYSQPGCCFDQTLFQYRVAFGPKFYQSVPTCFRAIDNQLFNQLAQQVSMNGQFQPAFVQPLVDQVKTLMSNPMMSMSVRQFQGCSARHGTPESYNFIQRVGGGNYMVLSFVTDEEKYNDFVSTLTQSCGWNMITEDECILRGCCWNDASNSCENPLGNITTDRINSAIQYMMFKQTFGASAGAAQNNANTGQLPFGGTPPVTGGSTPPFGGVSQPPFGGLSGRKRREAKSGLLGLLGGLGGMGGMMGGMGAMGGMAGGGLFGTRTIGQNEVCPATHIAKNCMAPSSINSFDMMQKMLLERHCQAKECCWDNARYQKSMFMNSGGASTSLMMCEWHVPDYSMYNMPSLQYSLRGCCDYSPCVERTGRDGTHIPSQPSNPTNAYGGGAASAGSFWSPWGAWSACEPSCNDGQQSRTRTCPAGNCAGADNEVKSCFTNCDPVIWTTWKSYGCSRTCGGGYETIYRSCVSGPCPTPQEVKHNQPCNTDVSCGSYGGWPSFGFFG